MAVRVVLDKKFKPVSVLLALFLLATMITVLMSGASYLVEYRKAVGPNAEYSLSHLRFLTREKLYRQYMKLTTPKIEDTGLPVINLRTDEASIQRLQDNLPASGKRQFVGGFIEIKDEGQSGPVTYTGEAEFRYRGGMPLHWFYDKKSYRVRLPPYETYREERAFNLVVPSTPKVITDWVSNEMSRELGILTPDYFPVELSINGEPNGTHFFLSRIDESFLRKNRRMPGSIYSGDSLPPLNYFGQTVDNFEVAFKDDEGLPLLWHEERLWTKDAARNAETADNRDDIRRFIDIVNDPSQVDFYRNFRDYFDNDLFYNYFAIDTLTGTYHHDLFHNHKLYFDPYKGKFEPIQWDIRFWVFSPAKDMVEYELLKQVALNPVLEYERDKVAFNLLSQFSVDNVWQRIEEKTGIIEKSVRSDPYRNAVSTLIPHIPLKEFPYTYDEYLQQVDALKNVYKERSAYLEQIYDLANAGYLLEPLGSDRIKLSLVVNGNSPVAADFSGFERLADPVKVSRQFDGQQYAVDVRETELLYPGRKEAPGNVLGRGDYLTVLAFGLTKLVYSPMKYEYIIEGASATEIAEVLNSSLSNAITDSPVQAELVSEIPDTSETHSIHPWELQFALGPREPQVITWRGDVMIDQDIEFAPHQRVVIEAGTTVRLCADCSVYFFGGLMVNGSADAPVLFTRADPALPWGAVVVQGEASSGSRLDHLVVEGGSLTSHRLINYTAQFNIHDLSDFVLSNCIIRSNSIGDDNLHVAYANGEIAACRFEDSAFDAIDADIADLVMRDLEFVDSGNDAMDFMTSSIEVFDVAVRESGDKCISVGEASFIEVRTSNLDGCVIGVAVKDGSEAELQDVTITDSSQAPIALYKKNARYSRGGTLIGSNVGGFDQAAIEADSSSTFELRQ